MPIALGSDILEIDRLRTILARRPALKSKLFTSLELAYCESKADPIRHFAVRFCAKEAFAKALGIGVRGFTLREVEVVNDIFGKPALHLGGNALGLYERMGGSALSLSMSHSREFALAVVVLEL